MTDRQTRTAWRDGGRHKTVCVCVHGNPHACMHNECVYGVGGTARMCAHVCARVCAHVCVSTCVREHVCAHVCASQVRTACGWAHTQDGDLAEKFLVHPALPQRAALRGGDIEGVQRASHPKPSHVLQIPM